MSLNVIGGLHGLFLAQALPLLLRLWSVLYLSESTSVLLWQRRFEFVGLGLARLVHRHGPPMVNDGHVRSATDSILPLVRGFWCLQLCASMSMSDAT